MTHLSFEDCTDYVRGLCRPSRHRAIETHLETGCPRCGRRVALLRAVAEDGAEESRQAPPASAVRSVLGHFGLQQPTPRWRPLPFRVAFDSLLVPAPAGVRGVAQAGRRLVVHTEKLALDLMTETESRDSDAVLLGEIVNPEVGPLAGVPAFLVAGAEILSHTVTDDLGHFRLGYDPRPSVRLCLLLDERDSLEVGLDPDEPVPGDAG